MKPHKNKETFKEFIELTRDFIGIPEHYIEKDYYVTLALKGLSESKFIDNGIFKGGTSLSKAYDIINRFSEDIDMVIVHQDGELNDEMSGKQIDKAGVKVMKCVEGAITSNEVFTLISKHEREHKNNRLRQTAHNIDLLFGDSDFGQVSPYLYVDISRISKGVPYESVPIKSYIYDFLKSNGGEEDIEKYELEPFNINVLCIERTFCEKFGLVVKLASQPKGEELPIDRLKDGIRHIYDLHMLLKNERIQKFISGEKTVDGESFEEFICTILQDDLNGMSSIEGYANYMNSVFADCMLYNDIDDVWKDLDSTYNGKFKTMAFTNREFPTAEEIKKSLEQLKALATRFDNHKAKNNIEFSVQED